MNQSAPIDTGAQGPVGQGRITPQAYRHNEMRREVLDRHPDLRALAGPDWRSAFAIPVLLALHWGVAWLVSGSNIFVVFVTAFFVGQMIIHSAGSLLHETAHKLIFRGQRAKLAFDLGLELIMSSFGKQLTYQHEHVSSHHPYMGDYERDYEHEDICALQARHHLRSKNPRVQRLLTALTLFIHALPLGFMAGDYIIPRLYERASGRIFVDRDRHIRATRAPVWQRRLFIAVSAGVNVALFALFGIWGWLYHVWAQSLFLGKCGVWNLGQSLAEHDGVDEKDPTRSYYGPLNAVLFNTGYHNEHHTFPNVSWTKLPELKRRAPYIFHNEAGKSYAGYWWDHVFHDFSASRKNPMIERDQSVRCPIVERITE